MSMSLMADVMHVKVGNPMAKLVLLKLAENAKDDGKCWPSHQHVATYCECSKASVRRHIAHLEEMGFLKKETRKGHKSGKGNASNVYYLTLNAADKLEAEETVNIPPEMECDDQSSCEDINYCAEVPQPAQPVLTESTPYVQTEHTPPMLTESIPYAHSEHTLCSQRAPEAVREPVREPVIKKIPPLPPCRGRSSEPAGKNKTAKPEQLSEQDYQAALEIYNDTVADRLPRAVELNKKRLRGFKRLMGQLARKDLEGFRTYVQAFVTNAPPFYFGENERGWAANLDYLLRAETLTKVREGTY